MPQPIKIHPQLHDVFGEQQSPIELAAIILFGALVPVLIYWQHNSYLSQLPVWKLILAMVFILDISAGCVANFTKSTNNFYAQRAKHRWIFISIHFHVLIVAYALNTDLSNVIYIWAYTMLAAAIVNLLKNTQFQIFFGGLSLTIGLTFSLYLPNTHPIMAIVQTLFMLKVIFSFAVDHYPAAKES